MGYPDMKGTTQYGGDEPDGDGLWEWLKSRWRALTWSPLRKAQGTYAEICANIPPPAPWPFVQLLVGTKRFECSGGKVKEVEVFNHRTPRSL